MIIIIIIIIICRNEAIILASVVGEIMWKEKTVFFYAFFLRTPIKLLTFCFFSVVCARFAIISEK